MFTIKVPWKFIFLFLVISTYLGYCQRSYETSNEAATKNSKDDELRRTKRSIYQALLKKKTIEKRSDNEDGISETNNIYSTTVRPYIPKQVQEIRIKIKLIHEWRDEMSNVSSPEFKLLVGNAIDALTNTFSANTNYLSATVTKLEYTSNPHQVLTYITLRFYKTEDDPVLHLQGIVSNGWIAGQQVNPSYFETVGATNNNHVIPKWHYPEEVQLHIVPAMQSSTNAPVHHVKQHHQHLTAYKEIRVSIKLKQRFSIFLQDKKSPEFSSLSGNVEEAITKIFAHDSLYIDGEVLDFKESAEGRVIVHCAVQFKLEEKYAIEKCQTMISSGDMEGMPVDDRFFVVNALTEYGGGHTPPRNVSGSNSNSTNKNNETTVNQIPQPQNIPKKQKAKPLRYKELRVSLKLNHPWNTSFTDNTTQEYNTYSATIELAVDRALSTNPNYIDATLLELLESPEKSTIANVAIRYKIDEQDPEGKSRAIIKNGTLSGLPADPTFFIVFSLSETKHPASNASNYDDNNSLLHNVSNDALSNTMGQKQPADDTPSNETQLNNFKQTVNNETANYTYLVHTVNPISKPGLIPNGDVVSSTISPITETQFPSTADVVTYNPYLPKTAEDITSNATPTFNPYLPVQTNTRPKNTNAPQVTSQYVPPQNNKTITPVTTSQEVVAINAVEGSMTLEQTWSPSFADRSTQIYKILEQTVVNAIRTIYTQEHEDVTPQVLGFSETNIPATSITVSTEKKVAVRFKVLFTKGHKADVKPLEHAVGVKSVSGIWIHQNSLVAVASKSNDESSGGGKSNHELTLCQEQQREAELVSEGNIGGFVPQCNRNGSYKPVQCHALTGYCWCVNDAGVRVQGTEEKYKEPNCDGIKFKGRVILPQHSPQLLLPNSCLTITVQEMILCGGDINCHIPIVANKTFKNLTIKEHSVSYELLTPRLKASKYNIQATINVGWCRINSIKSKDLIHSGDYHSINLNNVDIATDTRIIDQDIIVDVMLPEETGILLHGKVLLPATNPLSTVPVGSCLSIKTKKLNVCTGTSCPILPIYGNTTITDLQVQNNSIPYSIQMPDLDAGTYVISAVLHVGECEESDQTMVPGDYFNDEMHDYAVALETTDVEKDIKMVKLKDGKAGGVFISGRVLLPVFEQPLDEGSCLTISSRKLIQCKNNNCKIPPIATKTFENVTNDGGIPYTLLLPVASPGKYIISAVINNGWCKDNELNDWIHPEDFYNVKVHDFEIRADTLVVGKNINVEKFQPEQPKPGVTIHGRVILPSISNETFTSKSCLTIKAQEFKLCGGGINCINPLTAKETFHDFKLEAHTIPYAIVIPNVATGHFIISAVLNIDWCKDDDANTQDFIHNGDYHNEETHDFVISEGMTEVEKDITLEEYTDVVTAAPTTEVHSPSQSWQFTQNPTYVSTKVPRIKSDQVVTKEMSIIPRTTLKPPLSAISSGTARMPKSEITTPTSINKETIHPSTNRTPLTKEELAKIIVTTEQPHGNLIYDSKQPITIGVGQLYPIKTDASTSTIQVVTGSTASPALLSETMDNLITLPQGLPKSCQEVRDAGIGKLDGQYIIEAREGCHLSIICQDMEDKEKLPKEFLGGPSEAEWKYWHYAVLIKLSYQDKQNIPTGACLEKSEAGKELIKRIIKAGAQQGNPLADWQTNISQLLSRRGKRNIQAGKTMITKAIKIYKNPKEKRSETNKKSHWGVL